MVYHRILPVVEPSLVGNQYAYRRARGTEHHLVFMQDRIHRTLLRGHFAYVASFDIARAFDEVSHAQLISALEEYGIDVFSRRLIHRWIVGRTFIVKHTAPQGVFYGAKVTITSGLPQGGVLSPLLWLMVFYTLPSDLHKARKERGDDTTAYLDLIFADDVTTIVTAPTLETHQRRSRNNIMDVRAGVGKRLLRLQDTKTVNMLYRPEVLPQGVYRRSPPLSYFTTRTRLRIQFTREARVIADMLDFDPEDTIPHIVDERSGTEGFPYPVADEMAILGITFDPHMTLDAHFKVLLAKAQLRQGILTRVARTSWGLETTILKVTHDALLTSLLRYGLVVMGSCIPDDLMDKLDTQIINVAARRIVGLPITTRVEALHFIAGTHSSRNLYSYHCAVFLHSTLVCHGSGLRGQIQKEICALLRINTLEPQVKEVAVDLERTFLADFSGVPTSILEGIRWIGYQYQTPPNWTEVQKINSSHFVHAPEFRRAAFRRRQTYEFNQTHSWLDVGLQLLRRSGWSPECSQAHTVNIRKALPPDGMSANFFPGGLMSNEEVEDATTEQNEQNAKNPRPMVRVCASEVCVDKLYATNVVLSVEAQVQFCSGFVHGENIGVGTPAYVHEAVVLHAIRVLRELMASIPSINLGGVRISAGNALVNYQIRTWMQTGQCHLQSTAASGLIADIQSMPQWLHTRTVLHPMFLPDGMEQEREKKDLQVELLLRLAEHFRASVLTLQTEEWWEKIPKLPLTTLEIKELLTHWELADEQRILWGLAAMNSASAKIMTMMGLIRSVVAEAFVLLRGKRLQQVTLASVLSATRYKVLTESKIHPTKCPRTYCYAQDSFDHMLQCYGLTEFIQKGDGAAPFLARMPRVVAIPPGHRAIPYQTGHGVDP